MFKMCRGWIVGEVYEEEFFAMAGVDGEAAARGLGVFEGVGAGSVKRGLCDGWSLLMK